MRLSENLKERGLLYDVSDEKLYEKLDQGSMTFYLGADPTGDSLHIGHLATYMVAKRLADAGHQAILLIGGGTGLIGDPSGKSKERNLLTLEESLKNADALIKQVRTLIPSAQVVNNYDWLKDISMIGFLRDIGKHFNLNQMLAKETVKSRLESGISFTEFSYQIIQSLDFLHLFDHHHCQLQIGGQDQWGNITAGLDLIRKKHPEGAEAYGLTFPLITKSDGEKFGKTAGGAVWLDAEKTSPYAFYQYWLNLSDVDSVKMLYHFSLDRKSVV
jgi:tyrosyl-tRNA synthetase